jgi:hypothetical protein
VTLAAFDGHKVPDIDKYALVTVGKGCRLGFKYKYL